MERERWWSQDAEYIIEQGNLARSLRGAEGSGMNWRIRRALQMNEDYTAMQREACETCRRLCGEGVAVVVVVVGVN